MSSSSRRDDGGQGVRRWARVASDTFQRAACGLRRRAGKRRKQEGEAEVVIPKDRPGESPPLKLVRLRERGRSIAKTQRDLRPPCFTSSLFFALRRRSGQKEGEGRGRLQRCIVFCNISTTVAKLTISAEEVLNGSLLLSCGFC